MSQSTYLWRRLWPTLGNLLPLGLWGLLWLGVSPGSSGEILHPGRLAGLVDGLRAVLPFVAASLAATLLIYKLLRHQPRGFRFLSPLGLATVYGLVGVVAIWKSPDSTVALRWVALYLSVPLVLWAVVWGAEPLEQVRRIIRITWLAMTLGTIALFTIALIYLDLWNVLADPAQLLKCNDGGWYDLTSGRLRDTGVGRYAAIAAIVAISGLWQRSWRSAWTAVLVISMLLLMFSGARGAFGGFVVGAAMIVLLYGGRRAIMAGVLALVVLVPAFWATGAGDNFLDYCVFRTVESATPTGQPRVEIPPDQGSRRIRAEFFEFTGRSAVWAEALRLVRDSPVLGYGFHADRLLLGTHAHNAVVHSLLQTAVAGTIPFLGALLFGWLSLIRVARRLNSLPTSHKHLVIQSGGILAFLSMRTFPESTGAFFGVDWLILAPLLLYLHLVSSEGAMTPSPSS